MTSQRWLLAAVFVAEGLPCTLAVSSKPLMRQQAPRSPQQGDFIGDGTAVEDDDKVVEIPEALLEDSAVLRDSPELEPEDLPSNSDRLVRMSPAEEAEGEKKQRAGASPLGHVDPKVADAWLAQVMTEGLHPLTGNQDSAAREMDEWAKNTRYTLGDQLIAPTSAPTHDRENGHTGHDAPRLTASGGRPRQQLSLQESSSKREPPPDEECFEEWEPWTVCSATCWTGDAWQKRSRARLASAKSSESCTGNMEEMRVCNNHVLCPPGGPASREEQAESDEQLGCKVGDQVECPALEDYPIKSTGQCSGNVCCHHKSQSGETVTSVCPSAEAGWGDNECNYAKQADCTGGVSGYRVTVERHDISLPATEVGTEDPISVPDVGPTDHVNHGSAITAQHISTCKPSVCTKGWRLKFGLPDNFPCEASPCTEVECCELVVSAPVPHTTQPCPTNPRVEVVTVEAAPKKMSPSEALALDMIIACVGVLFCIVGFYLGRKWTQFQHWVQEKQEEEEAEAEAQRAADEKSQAAGAASAAQGSHH